MGLFSRKIVSVSSVVYNLAGEEANRPNFLKTVITGSTLLGKDSISESIADAYKTGPAKRLKNFGRWARTSGYCDAVGFVAANISVTHSVNAYDVALQIPGGGFDVSVISARIGISDYNHWVEQYVSDHHPERLNTTYTAVVNADSTITITYADTSTETFTPSGFVSMASYLYATYRLNYGTNTGPVITGSTVVLGPSDNFPSTAGWSYSPGSSTSTDVPVVLNTVTETSITYSDATPPSYSSNTVPTASQYTNSHTVYGRTIDVTGPTGSDGIFRQNQWVNQDTSGEIYVVTNTNTVYEDIGGGVIKTTVTTTHQDTIRYNRSYRIDTQDVTVNAWSTQKVFIYRQNTGNAALDAMWNPSFGSAGAFLPYIPIRVDNQWTSSRWPTTIYPKAKRAFKKATGAKFDAVASKIGENAQIGDIDYAYVAFGVPLNAKDNACRKYVYQFFKLILEDIIDDGVTDFNSWRTQFNAARQSWIDWNAWRHGNIELPTPTIIPYPPLPTKSISISSANQGVINYNMDIAWNYMFLEQGAGLLKPGAKTGEYWFEVVNNEDFNMIQWIYNPDAGQYEQASDTRTMTTIALNRQVSQTQWERLIINGLNHNNMIYAGNSVNITAKEALEDTDESGFLVPLHEDIIESLTLKDATQLAGLSSFLVFNCYTVKKTKWYQSGFFQILIIIVVIAISIAMGGISGASVGLLGTNAAVGASLGFAAGSMAAIVAGAVANAIAGMIVSMIIQKAAIAIFGDKLGAIIGALASFVAIQVGTAWSGGLDFSAALDKIFTAEGILKLTFAGFDGISGFTQADAMETAMKTSQAWENLRKQSKQIQDMFAENIGSDQGVINPMMLVGMNSTQSSLIESPAVFLQRTLLTGTEVADMTLGVVNRFSEITLQTDLPNVA